jgi:regulator of nucleoside diphosphate kinase
LVLTSIPQSANIDPCSPLLSSAFSCTRGKFPRERCPGPKRPLGPGTFLITTSFEEKMEAFPRGRERPPIHLIDTESDLVGNLALRAEHDHPIVAAMLLTEIDRAELHRKSDLPDEVVTLGAEVDFIDGKTMQRRTVTLVLPGDANIAMGRISILTPIGAALYGLSAG